MADKSSGEKTERATPKRLRDARKKGDVAKSRDVTSTLLLLIALIVYWQLASFAMDRLSRYTSDTLSNLTGSFENLLAQAGNEAVSMVLLLSALVIGPLVLAGLVAEFFQTGPILTLEKIKPQISNLNLADGLKRMFSIDSLFELCKSIIKSGLIVLIGLFVVLLMLPDLLNLPLTGPHNIGKIFSASVEALFIWTLGCFALISLLDLAYQRYSHARKMKMSHQDIRREHKDTEGDPYIKGHRQQLARDWSQHGATQAARDATVLVVNPTHIAIALHYDRKLQPIPSVTARGEDNVARVMREAAQQAHVPVLRNMQLARQLLDDTNDGDVVPKALFDIVAEVILWAEATTRTIDTDAHGIASLKSDGNNRPAPGEDLTHYPEPYSLAENTMHAER